MTSKTQTAEGKTQTNEGKMEKKFDPPLWIQRRAFVANFLVENAVNSVFDFGCGDGSLIQVLINSCKVIKLAGVDVSTDEIEAAVANCSPTKQDYLDKRELPVSIELFSGSIDQLDDRCKGWDAITMIEVIEHLPAKVLDSFPRHVFGIYRPKFVLISTPNADFNVNFPNLNHGTPKAILRHWDHQFEWTRNEFQEWSSNVAKLYNYEVSFHEVGFLVSKSGPDVGGCTQIAVFTRMGENEQMGSDQSKYSYQLISTIEYPYFENSNFSDKHIMDTVITIAKEVFRKELKWKPDLSSKSFCINLKDIWNTLEIRQMCKSFDKLDKLISSLGASYFIRLPGNELQCLFDIPSPSRDFSQNDIPPDIPSFEELCINSSDCSFVGWGEPDLGISHQSGW